MTVFWTVIGLSLGAVIGWGLAIFTGKLIFGG